MAQQPRLSTPLGHTSYQRYWRFLVQYLYPLRGKVVLLALLIFASIGLQFVNPQIIRSFIDMTLAAGAGAAPTAMAPLLWAAISFFVATLLHKNLLGRIFELPAVVALPEAPGAAIGRLRDDVNELPWFALWCNNIVAYGAYSALALTGL